MLFTANTPLIRFHYRHVARTEIQRRGELAGFDQNKRFLRVAYIRQYLKINSIIQADIDLVSLRKTCPTCLAYVNLWSMEISRNERFP